MGARASSMMCAQARAGSAWLTGRLKHARMMLITTLAVCGAEKRIGGSAACRSTGSCVCSGCVYIQDVCIFGMMLIMTLAVWGMWE